MHSVAGEGKTRNASRESIFRASSIGVGVVIDRVFTTVNDRFCEMTGYEAHELIGQSSRMLYPTERDFEYVGKEKYGQINDRGIGVVETRFRRKDGLIVDILMSSSPIHPDDQSAGVTFTALDITEHKRSERLLRVQHDLAQTLGVTRTLREALPVCIDAAVSAAGLDGGGVYLVDDVTGGLTLACSSGLPAALVDRVTHYTADSPHALLAAEGKPIFASGKIADLMPGIPDQHEVPHGVAVLPLLHEGRVIGCLNMTSRLLDEIPLTTQDALVGIAAQMGGAIARIQAEEALKESREKYRLIFEHSPEMIVLMDVQGIVIEANSKIEELLACKRAEIQGGYFWQLPFWSAETKIALSHWLAHGFSDRVIAPNELEFVLNDGTVLSCSMQGTRLADAEGTVTHVLCILSDVTKHRRAQNALREEKDRARKYLDVAGVILVALDTQERVTLINRKGCAVLRRSEEEIIGKNWYDVAVPKRQREIFRITYAMLIKGDTQAVECFESNIVTSEGEERTISWRNTVVRDASGQIVGTLSSGEDITDRKQAELSLRKRTEELKALNRFGDRAGASLLLEEVVRTTLDGVVELLPVDFAMLCLREGDALVLHATAVPESSCENDELMTHRRLGECLCGTAVSDGKPIYSIDVTTDPRSKWGICARAGYRSMVALPLRRGGESLGVLCLYARTEADFSRRAAFLEALAAEAAACLENALLYRRLETHASELEREVAERRRAEEQLRESREDFRRLAGKVLSAQEAERSRIARELHDDVTQRLALLAIETANIKRSEEPLPVAARAKLDALQARLETIATDVQAVSRVLHPSILKDLGLADAVASECSAFRRREGIRLTTNIGRIPADLADDSTLCLFRILQEALWNIAKHSCAERVEVVLGCRGSELLLRIQDDGIGFDVTHSPKQRGLGLASMRERARLVSGALSIQSQLGVGTTVEACIPLTEHST